jgi:hypothetical protein
LAIGPSVNREMDQPLAQPQDRQALGLTIPPPVLLRADQVIE